MDEYSESGADVTPDVEPVETSADYTDDSSADCVENVAGFDEDVDFSKEVPSEDGGDWPEDEDDDWEEDFEEGSIEDDFEEGLDEQTKDDFEEEIDEQVEDVSGEGAEDSAEAAVWEGGFSEDTDDAFEERDVVAEEEDDLSDEGFEGESADAESDESESDDVADVADGVDAEEDSSLGDLSEESQEDELEEAPEDVADKTDDCDDESEDGEAGDFDDEMISDDEEACDDEASDNEEAVSLDEDSGEGMDEEDELVEDEEPLEDELGQEDEFADFEEDITDEAEHVDGEGDLSEPDEGLLEEDEPDTVDWTDSSPTEVSDEHAADAEDVPDQADVIDITSSKTDDERVMGKRPRRDDVAVNSDLPESSVTTADGANDVSDVMAKSTATDASEPLNVNDMTQEEAYRHLSQYMNEHNYGRDDFSTYSMDPTWRNLQRKAFPDYEMPDMPHDEAQKMLSDYMNEHNYGKDDFFTYSQDEKWHELQRYANPEYELPPLFHRRSVDVNDVRDIEKVNPYYSEGSEWKENCQRCVPAYELRRRGYDVEALPIPNPLGPDDLCYQPFSAWVNPDIRTAKGTGLEDIESSMREWGDGARAQIVVKWNKVDEGHTFIAEQRNGRTAFLDPQDPSEDARGFFELRDGFPLIEEGSVSFCRIDTLEPSSRIFDACKGRE